MAELKRLLDGYHRWERPERYYDIIAGDWLELFAHLTYSAMAESLAARDSIKLSTAIPVCADLAAYLSIGEQQSGLHDHLSQAVTELLAGGSPQSWKFSASSAHIVRGGQPSLAHNALRSLATGRPDVLLVAPYFKCSRTEFASVLLGWRKWAAWDELLYPIRVSAMLDHKWRMNQACSAGSANNFLEVLKVLLPLHLPVALLEGFMAYRNAVLALPVARPKVIYSANALHSHLTFKLLAAEWRNEGTRLLYHQHGGGYGIDRIFPFGDFEIRVADRFFSWGWRDDDNPKVQPLSPAALHCPKKIRKRVLLSCCDFPKVAYRLHFHPMPGTTQAMHRETCTFLACLPDRSNLLVRPYPQDYGWGITDMMRKAAPDAVFDNHRVGTFERFAESRLVVQSYLGTGYLETLALNIPTVCFYDIDTYAFRTEAQPLMDGLESVGILHRSGKAAAHFVAALGDDPEGWWAKPEVQQARQNFVARYANFSSDWKIQWEREFRLAIEESS
ncbi:MAG: LIC12162 family protein [Sulfuritalea sp.]|nr:LIC12162 family protein [Sulfuritalea sp.]